MRLYMQNTPLAGEVPRYVQIVLEQDLLGGWTLYREYGQQSGRRMLKRQVYAEHDQAVAALERARDSQLKRGFQVMFAQGMDTPHGR